MLLFQLFIIMYALNVIPKSKVWIIIIVWFLYDALVAVQAVHHVESQTDMSIWSIHKFDIIFGFSVGLSRVALFFENGLPIYVTCMWAISAGPFLMLPFINCDGQGKISDHGIGCMFYVWQSCLYLLFSLNTVSMAWRWIGCWNTECTGVMTSWSVTFFPYAMGMALVVPVLANLIDQHKKQKGKYEKYTIYSMIFFFQIVCFCLRLIVFFVLYSKL